MTYNIYSKDGNTIRCFTDKVEYNGVFMGDVYTTITVKSEVHIDFEIGDYIMYRGEKFTLQNIPTEKKVSDKKVNGEVFQYDNIKFTGEAPFCFSNADFNDFVGDGQTDVSFTAQPNFSFIAATPADLAQRIQVNMDRYYTGADKWTIQMADGYVVDEDHENLLITVSNISCWDALALFKSKYDINFITRGRVCTIGTSGSIKDITFKVGSFKGLYDMTRNVQSDQSIITRLTSYGNTTNINPRYYSLVSATVIDNITHAYLYSDTRSEIVRLVLQFNLSHTTELRDNITVTVFNYTIKMVFGSFGNMAGYGISLLESDYSNISNTIYNSLSVDSNNVPQANKSVIINSGARKDNITDLSHISFDVDSKLPNNMAVTNLMLPGFPTQTLDEWAESNKYKYSWLIEYINQGYTFSEEQFYPYVNSKNISSLGIRPKTEYFTTDDETHKDIYPSLQYFSDDRNKVVSVFNEDGTSISDNGLYQDGATVPQIKINIKDLGFDFDDVVISGTEPKLHFNNGYCGGRDFTIKSWSLDNTSLYCERIKDDATGKYYPNVDSPILEVDIFVLSDIYMPDTYIEQASIELLRWNLKLLAKNDFTVFSYSLSPDNNFIKRHDDAIVDKSTTFHKTIKEGDFLLINDSDMNINGAITIDSLKINEGDGILPKYTITLKETKTVGTIQKVIQQIDALSGNGDTSGYNSSQIGQISYSYLKNRFLSKERNDYTPYNISIGKNLSVSGNTNFGNYEEDVSGGVVSIDEYGKSHAEFDFIKIRETAYFRSITVLELKHIGGELALTPAAMICNMVEELSDSYRCYFETTDGKRTIYQEFVVGDGARCQQFKFEEASNGYIKTKYYWRRVIAIGENYIDLSKTDCDPSVTNSIPSVEDNIIQLGYLGNNENNFYRRTAIILSTVASDSPSQKMYQGIDSYTLDNCLVKDDGYSNGIFHTNIYGNLYVGTKDRFSYLKFTNENGVEIKGKLSEGTQLEDGTEVNSLPQDIQNLATNIDSLNSGIINIVRNSGFTGDYQNIDLNANTELDSSTELYNNKLIYWDNSNASVSVDNDVQSGYSCYIASGYISQSLYYQQISNEYYVISFKAKGAFVKIEIGGNVINQDLTSEYKTYNFKFKSNGGYILRIAGDCTISEIQLSVGTIFISWAKSPLDGNERLDRFQAIKYITDAMADGSVQFAGGLGLMTMLMLGNYQDGEMLNVTSGLSGIYNNDNDVAFWSGGTFEQAIKAVQMFKNDPNYQITNEELSNISKAVITHGGRIIMNDAVIRGYIYALGGIFKDIKLSGSIRNPFENSTGNFNLETNDNVIVLGDGNVDVLHPNYTLPWTKENNGRKITIINYKYLANISTGNIMIKTPENSTQYFFMNGQLLDYLNISKYGVVELLGIGDSSTFYGWMVLHKKVLYGSNGTPMAALAFGSVISNGTDCAMTCWSFDDSDLSVVRNSIGNYTVTLPNTWSNYFVMVTGVKGTYSGAVYVNACIVSQDVSSFEVNTHDDASLNDGSFNFVIYNWSTAFNHV